MREQLFRNAHLGARALRDALGVALRVVDAGDLTRLHHDRGALLEIHDGLRIEDPLALARALAVVLFNVGDLGVPADVEGVDAVVLGVAVAAVVDAAARDDLHDRALAHKEVVVDHGAGHRPRAAAE